MTPATPGSRATLLDLLPLYLVIFLDTFGLGVIFPIMAPLFLGQDGFLGSAAPETERNLLYGITLTTWPLFMFFAAPILGDLSDQVGRKKIMLVCLAGSFASYGIAALAVVTNSLWLFIASRAVAGLTAGSQPIAQAAIIDVSTPETKAENLGRILLFTALGFMCGPIVGGQLSDAGLVSWFGEWTPLAVASLLSALNIVLLLRLVKGRVTGARGIHIRFLRGIQEFLGAFRTRSIRDLCMILLFMQLAWGAYFSYVTLFLKEEDGYGRAGISWFMAFLGACFALGLGPLLRHFTAWWPRKRVAVACLTTLALGGLVTGIGQTTPFVWGAGFFLITSVAISYSIFLTMLSDQVGPEKQGWVMGVAMSIVAFSLAVTSACASVLADMGPPSIMYATAALGAVATLLMLAYAMRRGGAGAPPPPPAGRPTRS